MVRSDKELLDIVDGVIKPHCKDALGCACTDHYLIEILAANLDNHRRRYAQEKLPTSPREMSNLIEALHKRRQKGLEEALQNRTNKPENVAYNPNDVTFGDKEAVEAKPEKPLLLGINGGKKKKKVEVAEKE